MLAITIRVFGRPAPKGSKRIVTRRKGGKPLATPILLEASPNARNWQTLVAEAAVQAMAGRGPLFRVAVSVSVDFVYDGPTVTTASEVSDRRR